MEEYEAYLEEIVRKVEIAKDGRIIRAEYHRHTIIKKNR